MGNDRFYWLVVAIVRGLMAVLFPTKFVGRENIPLEGPFIISGNHISMLDPVEVACVSRRKIHFMGKTELFQNRILRWFFTKVGAFPVERGANDMKAIRTAFSVLKSGGGLGMFPEGTRVSEGEDAAMKNGVAMIATRTQVPVIPLRVMRPYKLFRRQTVVIGPPIDLAQLVEGRGSEQLTRATGYLKQTIHSLTDENA